MNHDLPDPRPVPRRAFARNLRMGGVAGGMLGASISAAMGDLMRGRRPDLARAALNPGNAARLAGGLAHLRGAAMKLGQLMSMESNIALPPEVTTILAQLQAAAPAMPPRQLRDVLSAEWGADWQRHFRRFDVRPIAAASIGQVHRAETRAGDLLAIKVQFPGIAESIDSDIATLGRLLRVPGVLPAGMEIAGLLQDARAQLHDEADYLREGRALEAFGAHLARDGRFVVPRLDPDLTTRRVLVMEYVDSAPIDTLAEAPQAQRDDLMGQLITLTLRELFDFGQMQTDPNFANYRLAPDGRIVLLDFGATRDIGAEIAGRYRELLRALLAEDRDVVAARMQALGYFSGVMPEERRALIVALAMQASAPLRMDAAYDFGRSTLITDLAQAGRALGERRDFWHVPPSDLLFLHRKIGGMFLLAQRLGARVALRPVLSRWA
ncbi:MAG: AarF/ABC1/UbiB kinase family protein [Rhodobacteraceae bacterium]|nr:MAG: AarF/ABC1/UbiB kinase family protein [Paracoccaceae bacterium]